MDAIPLTAAETPQRSVTSRTCRLLRRTIAAVQMSRHMTNTPRRTDRVDSTGVWALIELTAPPIRKITAPATSHAGTTSTPCPRRVAKTHPANEARKRINDIVKPKAGCNEVHVTLRTPR